MGQGNGRPDALDDQDELKPGMAAWFAIEECVGETLDALAAIGEGAEQAHAFVSGIHRAVKAWLSRELWAALLDPRHYTPDGPLESVLGRRGCATTPALLTRHAASTGQAGEWRAFEAGEPGV